MMLGIGGRPWMKVVNVNEADQRRATLSQNYSLDPIENKQNMRPYLMVMTVQILTFS